MFPRSDQAVHPYVKPKRHDHRQSIWIIGGTWLWCYRCGAIRENKAGSKWTRTTGPDGANPAMSKP